MKSGFENWILIGMMGSGKTTIGKELAYLKKSNFYDLDEQIELRTHLSVSEYFNKFGEASFRSIESDILSAISVKNGVIATGGGIVLAQENWVFMKSLGRIIFLDASLELLIHRLKESCVSRPLLCFPDWRIKLEKIYTQRRALYMQADIIFKVQAVSPAVNARNLVEKVNV